MFFRPEAKAALWRWREVLVAGTLVLLGLWWLLGPGGLLMLPGAALLIAGIALGVVGVQRGRFRGTGDGAGAVQVDEGQVAYFGPLTGGVVALRDLERLSLDRRGSPAHWRLDAAGQSPVMIPVNAAGADALFDAFATLPALRTERMLTELRGGTAQAVVIWERTPLRPAHAVLH
ncbi:hypothetical protein KDD17_11635 [Sulfitobacter albidus]|uniref:DUF4175 domain-containing protein n=1 Tax=Sulfitobacter albidus TaxID=2829501 RepID=A0A975PLW5_9RHOB|nr:hypothetical protein [Sulfitobacter albidus]QUJ75605.1 hypothetical protein KDD17_11635 [Sulfitobacter albidus]